MKKLLMLWVLAMPFAVDAVECPAKCKCPPDPAYAAHLKKRIELQRKMLELSSKLSEMQEEHQKLQDAIKESHTHFYKLQEEKKRT